jgi:hypothetical protein
VGCKVQIFLFSFNTAPDPLFVLLFFSARDFGRRQVTALGEISSADSPCRLVGIPRAQAFPSLVWLFGATRSRSSFRRVTVAHFLAEVSNSQSHVSRLSLYNIIPQIHLLSFHRVL